MQRLLSEGPTDQSVSCPPSFFHKLTDGDSLAVLGFGPLPRGSTVPGKDAELQLIKHFPDAAMFIEKPISSDSFDEVDKVAEALQGRATSVGYMLRYLKGRSAQTDLKECSLMIL